MTVVKLLLVSRRFIIFNLFLLIIIADIHTDSLPIEPKARDGVLDLRKWNFKEDGPIDLHGQWQFYWQEFLPAQTSPNSYISRQIGFLDIPGYWKGHIVNGKPISGEGYATFLIKVLLPGKDQYLAIKIKDIQTAYSLYVNGSLIAAIGTIGKDENTSIPDYGSVVAGFFSDQSEVTIIVHISNFHHRKGGIWESLKLGLEQDIRKNYENRLSFEIFLASSIMIMGLYHISLFIHRKKDKTALYFGLFCLVITVRSLTTGERYLYQLLPNARWQILHRLEYLSFYIGLPLFLMYLHSIFPKDFSRKVLLAIQILATLFCLFVLVTPSRIYTYTVQTFEVITSLAGLYSMYILVLAVVKKKEGALILLSGFIFMFVLVINDVLHSNQLIHTGYYLPLGLLVFIFSQAYLIALRFTMMFQIVENQTMELKKANNTLGKEIVERKKLEINLVESHEQFEQSRIGIILGLAKLAEYRDEDTGTHLERIREYSRILAGELSNYPNFSEYITDNYIDDLFHSAILHDIGKVGISDSILLKPGKLTQEEFRKMQRHPSIGGDAILNVESKIDLESFLTLGREIAYFHHEKWDGSGYPDGLKGESIPLSARIIALADVYDALTSERPYKKAFPHKQAFTIILENRGSHFDPVIVDAFISREIEFNEVRQKFQND